MKVKEFIVLRPRLQSGSALKKAFFATARTPSWIHAALLVLAALSMTVSASAQANEAVTTTKPADGSAGIDAAVAAVQGTTILTQSGIQIDLSNAIITSIAGEALDLSAIQPGVRVRATLETPLTSRSQFVARFVQVRLDTDIVLSGPLQAIDFENGFITVFNRRISISESTFGLIRPGPSGKLKVGRSVTVVAVLNGSELVAKLISQDSLTGFILLGFL